MNYFHLQVTFSLTNETHKELFEIRNLGNNSADLLTAGGNMFDRENLSYYSLGLVAMDGAPKSPPDPRNPLQPNSGKILFNIYEKKNLPCSL